VGVSLVSYFKSDINHEGASASIVGCGQYCHWAKGLARKFSGLEVDILYIICWHQSKMLYGIYQQDVPITLFVSGYSGHTLLKYDACFQGALHITPNVQWVQFDSRVQTTGVTSSWSGGILGKLIVVSLVRKFLASYTVRRFINLLAPEFYI
jgi:hypothetical protein